jgi:hypothetical protein
MSETPPVKFSETRIRLNRFARRILWPRPAFYFPFGLLRQRGSVFNRNFEIYISGYPRCGNTFARTAFLSANPGARVQSHRHIPSFVLQSVKLGVPGLVLLRSPLDAAVSWAIHENQTLEEAIAYWNDYYETLLPVRSELFIARFEDVTRDFGGIIKALNQKWNTSFVPFDHTPENAAECFRVTEEEHRQPSGLIREMQVCRPSPERRSVKETHLQQLNQSSFLRDELARASIIYETFLHFRGKDQHQSSTRLIPEKADNTHFRMGAPV